MKKKKIIKQEIEETYCDICGKKVKYSQNDSLTKMLFKGNETIEGENAAEADFHMICVYRVVREALKKYFDEKLLN